MKICTLNDSFIGSQLSPSLIVPLLHTHTGDETPDDTSIFISHFLFLPHVLVAHVAASEKSCSMFWVPHRKVNIQDFLQVFQMFWIDAKLYTDLTKNNSWSAVK